VDNTNKILKIFQEIFGGKKEEGKCPNCDKPFTAQVLKQIFTGAANATLEKAATTYTRSPKSPDFGLE
jgi:hypothetical protein